MKLTKEECIQAITKFYENSQNDLNDCDLLSRLIDEHFDLLEKYEQLNKSFDLFIEWADECDFGYDNIPDLYEKYEEEIKDMRYYDGFKYIAMKEAEREAKDRVY